MTNLEYIQQLGKGKGLEYLRGVCPRHPCHDCTLNHDGDDCAAYTAGADELAEWLFKEREKRKGDAGHPVAPEMYALLESVYEALWSDGYMYARTQGLRADISTVLAKARGEKK